MIKIKKATIIVLGCGILTAGVTTGVFLSLPKEDIVLTIEDNKIWWTDNSRLNLLDSSYHIYNDDFLVNKIVEQSYFLSDEKLIDEIGPDKVKKINIKYTDDMVEFQWEDAEDLGTDNNIKISLYDKNDRLKSFSNTVKKTYSSGISKYILEFNGESFDVWDNKFSVKISDLKDGITHIKLYAIDKRGNRGTVTSIPLYNYKIILSRENDFLRFDIDDVTQKYLYKAIINGKDAGYIVNGDELNSLLVDNKAPKSVENVKIISSNKLTSITWDEAKDIGNTYTVKIIASGMSYFNNAVSDEITIDKKSEIKGYYYAINKENIYTVTEKDVLLKECSIDHLDDYGTYYFHIASVDNNNNISETKTYTFEKKDPTLDDNKNNTGNLNGTNGGNINGDTNNSGPNNVVGDSNQNKPSTGTGSLVVENSLTRKIKSLIRKVGNVSDENFNKAVAIIKNIPESTINSMLKQEVYIYLTSDEAETVYKTLTGKNSDKAITGSFIWGDSATAIICETAYMDSTLYHEIGHAFDYMCGNGSFISNSDSFKNIFNIEKDYLFSSNDYAIMSENEYFAEVFAYYYNDNKTLKNKANKTYEFLKQYLN